MGEEAVPCQTQGDCDLSPGTDLGQDLGSTWCKGSNFSHVSSNLSHSAWHSLILAWGCVQCPTFQDPNLHCCLSMLGRAGGYLHPAPRVLPSLTRSLLSRQWDLVCESKTLKQMAQSIYMAGILVGSALFGSLSDK